MEGGGVMDAQSAWLATARIFTTRNTSHAAGRAKYRDFVDGVLTLEVNNYVLAALAEITSSMIHEFNKFSETPCREIVLDNPNADANIQPDEPPPGDCEAELSAAYEEIRRLRAEIDELRDELAYRDEWGGLPMALTPDGVFIDRSTLQQVAAIGLNKDTPRTAAPLFLYILSQADDTGQVAIEAKTVCRDVLGFEHKRSWGNLLGAIFGTLVTRDGHQLKVTASGYRASNSNHTGSPTDESIEVSGNHMGSSTDKSNHMGSPKTAKVTTRGHFSPVIMNDDDINKTSSIGTIHSLPPDTQKRLDQRQRQLHAIGFNPDMAERYQEIIIYAPDVTWDSWLEQSNRSKNPAGLMCSKIKGYYRRRASKVISMDKQQSA